MGFFNRLFNLDKADAVSSKQASLASQLGLDAKAAALVLAEIDIDNAISIHENWKLRLQNYVDHTSNEALQTDAVALDDHCELGKWLHGRGGERLGKYPTFQILVARHQYFHTQASTVVAQVQGNNLEAARKTLDGSYRYASSQVVVLLKELKRNLTR
ncbi:MAG: hypothetical protein HHJ16_03710 [Polaromonas sp.]|uniref:CZB domain-containing protein n=1 Tax=Polaromonas sp. TaxID=1869339 RepID=UPI0017BEA66A|nr:CZB domain-containing protein [Polaromonas sp.]NMM09360.1 hypothetical protein [Polaromonas sp.]